MIDAETFSKEMAKIDLNAQRMNLYAETYRLQKEGKLNSAGVKKLITNGLHDIQAGKRFPITNLKAKKYVESETALLLDKMGES